MVVGPGAALLFDIADSGQLDLRNGALIQLDTVAGTHVSNADNAKTYFFHCVTLLI